MNRLTFSILAFVVLALLSGATGALATPGPSDTLASTRRPTTYVSTYTARGRALFVLSNQSGDATVETVRFRDLDRFGAGGLQRFYDAETGGEIETTREVALKTFLPGMDYRVVLGLPQPWKFAAKEAIGMPDLEPQSTLDPEVTLTAISKQLLHSRTLQPIPGAHRLYEEWMKRVFTELPANSSDVVYLDAAACADVDFGKPGIACSVSYNRKLGAMLVDYYNGSDQDVSLPGRIRDTLAGKASKPGHNYILHPVFGYSEWEFIDIPAHRGLLEIYYSDSPDFSNLRNGPFQAGTMLSNINRAVEANQRALGGR